MFKDIWKEIFDLLSYLTEFLENKPPQRKIEAEETKCLNNHATTLCKTEYKA